MRLTPIQEKIVKKSGNLIVQASAGTGKTHTMVEKIVYEIDNNKSHKVIAAITFTIKAAKEIKDRLAVDISQHFIGTNNSFVIEEVIKPFMKDVYGSDFDLDFNTDYSVRVNSFNDGIKKIKEESTLCSYTDNKKNFIFELAKEIVEKSEACKLYLQAKYFKIYIDEYQDCDRTMHNFFIYLCDNLSIQTFIVGDEKQSIYIWRGAYPEAFKSILQKDNFTKVFMGDNFRSCQNIQNYSNLLCEETRHLYLSTNTLENIIFLTSTDIDWPKVVKGYLDLSKKSALLRFRNDNAKNGATLLTNNGMEFVYIPQTPITEITTNSAWFYLSIAKYFILEKYSVYDLISEIPSEGESSKKTVSKINNFLKQIDNSLKLQDINIFQKSVKSLADYLGYVLREDHIEKLYQTITVTDFHVSFEQENLQNVAITFHSSKGLEFDQVIIFAEDYNLADMPSIFNHYVAVTRAKEKLIIISLNNYKDKIFKNNLYNIFKSSGYNLTDLMTII